MFATLLATTLFLANQENVDLTHTLSKSTIVYPGKMPLSRVICAYYQSGYRLDDIHLSSGIGTHMDAPNHFCSDGVGIDAVPLEQCYGEACVVHLVSKVGTNADYAITKIEMEGAAVAQVCKELHVPFVVMRSISDKANHEAAVDFLTFMDRVAGTYSLGVLKEYIQGPPLSK